MSVMLVATLPKPPKVGKIMAQNLQKAIILHTFGVQVSPKPYLPPQLAVGRGVANDVVLDFDGVSVYHAEIHCQMHTWIHGFSFQFLGPWV